MMAQPLCLLSYAFDYRGWWWGTHRLCKKQVNYDPFLEVFGIFHSNIRDGVTAAGKGVEGMRRRPF